MTDFATMLQLTYDQTRRPELVTLTKAAVKIATLRAHRVASFPRDNRTYLATYTPNAQSSQFVDILNLYAIIPNLRTIHFNQGLDPTTGVPVENLEYRDPRDTFDKHGVLRQSIYTQMGDTLRLYPVIQSGKNLVYHYVDPTLTEVGYSSWIADAHPEELAMWAASIVKVRTGDLDQAKMNLQTNVQPFKEMLVSFYMNPEVN